MLVANRLGAVYIAETFRQRWLANHLLNLTLHGIRKTLEQQVLFFRLLRADVFETTQALRLLTLHLGGIFLALWVHLYPAAILDGVTDGIFQLDTFVCHNRAIHIESGVRHNSLRIILPILYQKSLKLRPSIESLQDSLKLCICVLALWRSLQRLCLLNFDVLSVAWHVGGHLRHL